MKKFLLTIICSFIFIYMYAQDSSAVNPAEQATGLRANEKIYVVVAVLGTILAGIFIYIIRLDRKISRLERGEK